MKRNPRKLFLILFSLCTSILCITICSKCSPMYSFNDWVDANAFFTMGKGWMNGLIPYRDLFEQKGPILYLIYGIGSLFSYHTFFGIYLLEILSFSVFLYYSIQIALKVLPTSYAVLATFVFGVLMVSSTFFVQGGSAEEFCLPFLMFSMYYFLMYLEEKKLNAKWLFFNGLAAGIVALIKFNLLGFWFIWMALLFFQGLQRKEIKEAIFSVGYFLLGMFLPIFLISFYFLICGVFGDFIHAYVTFNFNSYTVKESIFQRMYHAFLNFKNYFLFDKTIFHLTVFGFLGILFSKKFYQGIWVKIFFVFSFVFLSLGIYFGGNPYIYYYLLPQVYMFFGILLLFTLIEKKFQNKRYRNGVFVVFVLFSIFFSYKTFLKSNNIHDMKLQKEDYVQYQFASIIHQKENPTLLNYDFLDGGFYTATSTLPSTKYFMRQNISHERFPDIMNEQNRIIRESLVDFVIVREYFDNEGYHETIDYLNENYDLVEVKSQEFERILFTYYLYQRKE